MKQFIGYSEKGNCKDALNGLTNPTAIVYIAGKDVFEQATAEIAASFPSVETIGCVGQSYAGKHVNLEGITVVGFYGNAKAIGGIMENVGTMPLLSIADIQEKADQIGSSNNDTVCLDFTCGNDAQLVTTLNIVLQKKGIPLVGGTAWEDTVSYNGKIYHNATAYLFLKNLDGKIRTYRENLYEAHESNIRYIATKVDTEKSIIYELDGQPVQKVYMNMLGVTEKDIPDQTFINPLGRYIGNELYLISLKSKMPNGGLECYKKVNSMDILTIMQLKDYNEITQRTLDEIKQDFSHISGMFSINCIFRYLLFEQKNYMKEYLQKIEQVGPHAGLIGLGEHYNTQHVNQTMSCFVFE